MEESLCDLLEEDALPTRFEPKQKLFTRFLTSCKGNQRETLELLSNHLQWRKENSVDSLVDLSLQEILKLENDQAIQAFVNHLPIIERGEDKLGRPVLYMVGAKFDVRKANQLVSPQNLFRYLIWIRERSFARLDLYESGLHRNPPYFTMVLDLEGVRLSQATTEFYSFIKTILSLDQYQYPGRIDSMIIVNVPIFFNVIWGGVRGWIGPSADKRVKICSNKAESQTSLSEIISASQLPSDFGGTAVSLPYPKTEKHEDFFCEKVHFCFRISQLKIMQIQEKSDAVIEENDFVEEISEFSALIPVIGRSSRVAEFHDRVNNYDDFLVTKADLISEIQKIQEETNNFERNILVVRARLRRKIKKMLLGNKFIPVYSSKQLHDIVQQMKQERDAHIRAVAFAKNYMDIENQNWSSKQRMLRIKLDKVMEKNRELRRIVEVALGNDALQRILNIK